MGKKIATILYGFSHFFWQIEISIGLFSTLLIKLTVKLQRRMSRAAFELTHFLVFLYVTYLALHIMTPTLSFQEALLSKLAEYAHQRPDFLHFVFTCEIKISIPCVIICT